MIEIFLGEHISCIIRISVILHADRKDRVITACAAVEIVNGCTR